MSWNVLVQAAIIVTALAANAQEIQDRLKAMRLPSESIYTLTELDTLLAQNPLVGKGDQGYRLLKRNKAELARRDGDNTYLDWWCPEHFCPGDILVYQCGKVGSSTIINSLAAAGVGATHVHMLTDRFIFDLIPELAWQPDAAQAKLIDASSQLCIERIIRQKPLKIITLVREPLSRDYSSFVYHLGNIVPNAAKTDRGELADICAQGMMRRATQNGTSANGYMFDWFDDELKAVFGVDVYASPFDITRGFSIIHASGVEVLALKLERLAELAPVIGHFVGVSDFQLINANQSSKKDYYELYKQLRHMIKLPRQLVELYYGGNAHMDHFYSQGEQTAFLQTWEANIQRDAMPKGVP
jgi:Putative capsular polysaccharide synthesis protein